MTGFGASAPAAKLFEHFGITAAHVAAAARQADQALLWIRQAQDQRPGSTSRVSACWSAPISTCRSRTARSPTRRGWSGCCRGSRSWPSAARASSSSRTSGAPRRPRSAVFSLRPVAHKLGELLGQPVAFAADCVGEPAERTVADAAHGGSRGAGEFALPQGRREERSRVRQGAGQARRHLSSTTPSPPRIARTPRPRPSRGCCRPMPARC